MTTPIKIFRTYIEYLEPIVVYMEMHPDIIWEKREFFSQVLCEQMVDITIENNPDFLSEFKIMFSDVLLP